MVNKRLHEILLRTDYDELLRIDEPNKIARYLISLSYDKSELIAWKSIEAIGRVAALVSAGFPDFGRNIVRRLIWSIRDESGGIGWSAPEMIGEIVRNDPEKYPDIPQILWANIDEEFLQKGIIWAVGRIAESSPELVRFSTPELKRYCVKAKPDVRLYAAWALCKFGIIPELARDSENITAYLYEDMQYKEVSLREIISKCKNSDEIKR
ncbi:MAG: HEAT repeat domain-containing protein [Nitrospirota bacterium]|nr:HEAT repeat domain-containing protein [Nitrospirota bacterium]MDH5768066.1 HEAT repeat domain-containing protein [Nitrospirota bacterium]